MRVLSKLFRRLMLEKLAAAHKAGKLRFFGEFAHLASADAFAAFLAPIRKTKWFVYSKRPFSSPKTVLAYLSRYTHRVAISNRRLVAADKTGVTFKYKDYRIEGPSRYKTMTLGAHEFIRRFLTHVLPRGFHRYAITGFWPAACAQTIWPPSASGSPWTHRHPTRKMRPRPVKRLRRPHAHHRNLRRKLPPAAKADTGSGRERHVMSKIARACSPIADSLRRRFQAGYGGACPAAAHCARSGLCDAAACRCRSWSTVPATLPRLIFLCSRCQLLPACALMAEAKSS